MLQIGSEFGYSCNYTFRGICFYILNIGFNQYITIVRTSQLEVGHIAFFTVGNQQIVVIQRGVPASLYQEAYKQKT